MSGCAEDVAAVGPRDYPDDIANDSVADEVVVGNPIEILVEEKPVRRRGRPKKVLTKRGRYDRKSMGLTKEKAISSSNKNCDSNIHGNSNNNCRSVDQ